MYNATQMAVLTEITGATRNLRYSLERVRDAASIALAQVTDGKAIGVFSGPLSGSDVLNTEQHAATLNTLSRMAVALKIDAEHVTIAQKFGMVDLWTEEAEEFFQQLKAVDGSKSDG